MTLRCPCPWQRVHGYKVQDEYNDSDLFVSSSSSLPKGECLAAVRTYEVHNDWSSEVSLIEPVSEAVKNL